jgi:hypothetical protein
MLFHVKIEIEQGGEAEEESSVYEGGGKVEKTSKEATKETRLVPNDYGPRESSIDRFMESYAKFLIRPPVKVVVVLGFSALTLLGAYSASQIRQEFSFQDVLPSDSYLADFLSARADYANLNQMQPGVFFRNVDQSDKLIQQQMKDFLVDLRTFDGVSGGPDFCWLYDFEKFVNDVEFVRNLGFNDQLGFFLGCPTLHDGHSPRR